MKTFVTIVMLATTTSLSALVASPAAAASHRDQQQQALPSPAAGEGYYEGSREFRIDSRDHASSPYAGGA